MSCLFSKHTSQKSILACNCTCKLYLSCWYARHLQICACDLNKKVLARTVLHELVEEQETLALDFCHQIHIQVLRSLRSKKHWHLICIPNHTIFIPNFLVHGNRVSYKFCLHRRESLIHSFLISPTSWGSGWWNLMNLQANKHLCFFY